LPIEKAFHSLDKIFITAGAANCYLPRFIFRERGYCLHGRITGAIRVARLAGLEIDLVKITKTYQETSF